ncbi:head GIN domain-containing protein [Maribellus sp. YY47]|uniref:head GIN domain-containing protein n=1 Tax=Maribellus sp. YY47 TaxID=2929486 RepID=UPI00200164BB|nr:head GIN domain-containing protein [Maribellus sp. YY47]MCK3682529.1 DUF2807 domain-containing protein [Maribellus sp. YY47]
MKTITFFAIGVLFLLVSAVSCTNDFDVSGNGIQASENRTVPAFSKVNSHGAFQVYITSGEESSVVVSADENLLQFIDTWVSEGTLHIKTDNLHSVRAVIPMEVFIKTLVLNGIYLSGSGLVESDLFQGDDVKIVLSGSGRIQSSFEVQEATILLSGSGRIDVSGFAGKADVTVSGSGKINGAGFEIADCKTLTSGSGDMWLTIGDDLDSRISGSGNVFYYGNPTVKTYISGSGNVYHQE